MEWGSTVRESQRKGKEEGVWNEKEGEEKREHGMEKEGDEDEGSQRGRYGEEDSWSSGREGKSEGSGEVEGRGE